MVRTTATLASLVGVSLSMLNLVSAGGMIGQVVDSTSFCIFLPPPGQMSAPLSDNEWDSQAYCMGSTPKATDANTLPSGFIQSAHFVATDDYVQVTGQFDPTKIGLNPTDEGGQCDIMAPKGSTCAGYAYYVNIVEPANKSYCMRCCNDVTNCNRGISQDGCARVIPGDYSGPMDGTGSGVATASSAASTSSAPASSSSSVPSASSSSALTSSSTLASSSSVSLPSSGSSSSVSPSKNSPVTPNGSKSGDLGQTSMTAQSVNQASSMTGRSFVAGGLIGVMTLALAI